MYTVGDIYDLAEQYANSGIQIVKDLEKDSSYENYQIKFERLVKKDIDKILKNSE